MDKNKLMSMVSKHSGKIKYVPAVKKGITTVVGANKNRGKLTKTKVEWIAAGAFVMGCVVKRVLKY